MLDALQKWPTSREFKDCCNLFFIKDLKKTGSMVWSGLIVIRPIITRGEA